MSREDGRLTRQSPPPSDLRIIGVELTVTEPSGRTEELAMFSVNLDVADVFGPRGERYYAGDWRANITLHTSEGDRGAQILLR